VSTELVLTSGELSGAEADLVRRARKGRREAREELARRLRRPAYLLALQLTGNPDDALDVAQDALLSFYASLGRFQVGRPVLPWLFRIVRNRVKDLQRRSRVRRSESLDRLLEVNPSVLASAAPGPESRAELGELQRRVWKALARLSAPHREILVLREYQDLSYAEIASVLRIPAGTVMSRLHAARQRLRTELESGETVGGGKGQVSSGGSDG